MDGRGQGAHGSDALLGLDAGDEAQRPNQTVAGDRLVLSHQPGQTVTVD